VPDGGFAVDGDLEELEPDGVEQQLVGRGVDAPDVEGGPGAEAPRGDDERHVEDQVIDGEGSVALEVARAGGQREGTAGGGGGQVLGGPYVRAAAPRVKAMLEGMGNGSFTRRSA